MSEKELTRRHFVRGATAAGGTMAVTGIEPTGASSPAGAQQPSRRGILNFNEQMKYRRLGKTGLMVSAVCLGGHWKRLGTLLPGFKGLGYAQEDFENVKDPAFLQSRDEVLAHSIEAGINYLDACAVQEILAYGKLLKGRRDKMHVGFSWHLREPRYPEWRDGKKLLEALDMGLKESGLGYADLWRITLQLPQLPPPDELRQIEESTIEALAAARKQGKARFTGISSHNPGWLGSMIERFPDQIQVVLFPFTGGSKERPENSLFSVIRKHDVGVFTIKPFCDNMLFAGDSSPESPHRAEDDRRARLAVRNILSNLVITAPIPGLISTSQVDNMVRAVREGFRLSPKEKAEFEKDMPAMWAKVPPNQSWLKNWELV